MTKQYQWLQEIEPPRLIAEAIKLYGTVETSGSGDNPSIMEWAKQLGLEDYVHDAIPWCGLLMAIVCVRADKPVVKDPLWAMNWSNFGQKIGTHDAALGDILIFSRPGGNHVTLYVAEDDTHYHCLGGNQSDSVNIIRIEKSRLRHVRRPIWKTAQPKSVQKYYVSSIGLISKNEL